MKPIRFAPIPKCASRSLKALGLLGEIEGRCHTKVTDYPDWQKYQWFAVDRPEAEWLESWWYQCQVENSMFAQWLGFTYEDMGKDLEKLLNPPTTESPRRPKVNQWVLDNFTVEYLASGLSFKDFCYSVITDGVPCERIQLADLDQWLTSKGFTTVHENKRGEDAIS